VRVMRVAGGGRRAIVSPMRLRHLLALLPFTLAVCGAHADSAVPAQGGETEYNLGVAAFRAEDYAEARRHWQLCALEEDAPPEVFNNLGYLLHEGLGGDADLEGSIVLWRKAAELGVSESQMHLGAAYEYGEGVEQDLVEAYAWERLAMSTSLAAGDVDVEAVIRKIIQRQLDRLREVMTPAELDEGGLRGDRYILRFATRRPA